MYYSSLRGCFLKIIVLFLSFLGKRQIENKFIARFANLGELEKYATKTSDIELAGKIRIVKTYHQNLPMCISKILQKCINDLTQAGVAIYTYIYITNFFRIRGFCVSLVSCVIFILLSKMFLNSMLTII